MNIIKQLKDVNGNNIYPIAYAQGGMKMDLLWTNTDITQSFAAQTVTLDLSSYAAVYISAVSSTSNTTKRTNNIVRIGDRSQLQLIGGGSTRRIYEVTSTGVVFEGGLSGDSASNSSMIPYQIFGIKTSYVVPTSVHGLQYVEV